MGCGGRPGTLGQRRQVREPWGASILTGRCVWERGLLEGILLWGPHQQPQLRARAAGQAKGSPLTAEQSWAWMPGEGQARLRLGPTGSSGLLWAVAHHLWARLSRSQPPVDTLGARSRPEPGPDPRRMLTLGPLGRCSRHCPACCGRPVSQSPLDWAGLCGPMRPRRLWGPGLQAVTEGPRPPFKSQPRRPGHWAGLAGTWGSFWARCHKCGRGRGWGSLLHAEGLV